MKLNIYCMVVSYFCGYLLIEWTVIESSNTIQAILLEFIFNPLKFLASSAAGFTGTVMNARLFRCFLGFGKEQGQAYSLAARVIAGASMLLIFAALFSFSPIHAVLYFGLGLLYGIISIYF